MSSAADMPLGKDESHSLPPILFAALPLLGYAYSYAYERAYAAHFGIPGELVTVSFDSLFSPAIVATLAVVSLIIVIATRVPMSALHHGTTPLLYGLAPVVTVFTVFFAVFSNNQFIAIHAPSGAGSSVLDWIVDAWILLWFGTWTVIVVGALTIGRIIRIDAPRSPAPLLVLAAAYAELDTTVAVVASLWSMAFFDWLGRRLHIPFLQHSTPVMVGLLIYFALIFYFIPRAVSRGRRLVARVRLRLRRFAASAPWIRSVFEADRAWRHRHVFHHDYTVTLRMLGGSALGWIVGFFLGVLPFRAYIDRPMYFISLGMFMASILLITIGWPYALEIDWRGSHTPKTLLQRFIERVGPATYCGIVVAILFLGIFAQFGAHDAAAQRDFLFTDGDRYVVLRRYGDSLLAARYTNGTLKQDFRLIRLAFGAKMDMTLRRMDRLAIIPEPELAPPFIDAAYTTNEPSIDDDFDESDWRGASRVALAWNGNDEHSPRDESTVEVQYDDANLYCAFLFSQEEPLTTTRRFDARTIDDNDAVIVALWSSASRSPFVLGINARGVPYASARAKRVARWRTKTDPTRDGYMVRVAIPFNTLGIRAPTTLQIRFVRYIAKKRDIAIWPLHSYVGLLERDLAGTIRDLHVSPVTPLRKGVR
jgi:hypothetical protein